MKKVIALAVFVSGFALAGAAVASEAVEDQWLLAKYDVNGDSVISVNEIEDKRKRVFGAMDADSDGGVSFSEYEGLDQRKRQMILKARFNKLDLDQDGQLSGAEYSSYLGSFDRLDQNGDGRISQHEISKVKTEEVASKSTTLNKKNADVCLLWVCLRKKAF